MVALRPEESGMTVLSPPCSPRKRRPRIAGSAAQWRQDPEVRLMLRVQDGDATGFVELEKIYRTRVPSGVVKKRRNFKTYRFRKSKLQSRCLADC